ncbi:MAG: hypothetical protein IJW65_05910 [Clostridia bacterium]|nr:hypothetical protein [Clostridia bacterium]
MKKTTRIITTLILAIALCVGASVSTFATDVETAAVQPRWVSIGHVSHEMTFSDAGNGNVTAVAMKQSTATSIEATLTLYKKIGSYYYFVDSVSGSKTIGSVALSIDFPCTSGVTYKSVLMVTAYTGSDAESEMFEVIRTCP